jgi:hypothetical protein
VRSSRAALGQYCARVADARTFSLPVHRRLCDQANVKRWEYLRPIRCNALRINAGDRDVLGDLFPLFCKRDPMPSDTPLLGTLCVRRFVATFAAHPLKERTRIGNHGHTAQFPILRTSLRVAAHNDFPSIKVHIAPSNLTRFTFPTAGKR